MRWPHSAAQVE